MIATVIFGSNGQHAALLPYTAIGELACYLKRAVVRAIAMEPSTPFAKSTVWRDRRAR